MRLRSVARGSDGRLGHITAKHGIPVTRRHPLMLGRFTHLGLRVGLGSTRSVRRGGYLGVPSWAGAAWRWPWNPTPAADTYQRHRGDTLELLVWRNSPLCLSASLNSSEVAPVWVRLGVQRVTTSVQLLVPHKERAGASVGSTAGVVTYQTLLAATSATVAAALGFTRQQRSAAFIQQALFKHVRRALLLLEVQQPQIWLIGAIPRFRALWVTMTRATGEVFRHPLTKHLMADLRITRQQAQRAGSAHAALDVALGAANWLGPDAGGRADLAAELKRTYAEAIQHRLGSHSAWQRYWVVWSRAWVMRGAAHGCLKQRRARSIKKRLAKRLVRTTQYRFWPR